MSTDVLIIEDDEITAFAMSVILSDEHISAREAYSGEEGLRAADEESSAVVLLDVRLPGIDGWEVCRRLKQSPEGPPVVVFVTGATGPADRLKAREVGGDAFIAKPFDAKQLVETVKGFLSDRKHTPHHAG